MKTKLVPLAIAAIASLVVGASLAVAFGPFGGGESSPAREAAGTLAPSPTKLRPASRVSSTPQKGCANLELTPSARAELEEAPVKGSTYYGACNGHRWWMTRFPDGSDGVFKDGSSTVIRIGSIAEAKCKVPYGLLKIWRQAEDCIAASSDPSADPDDPQSTVKQPDPSTVKQPDPQEGQGSNPRPDGQRRYPNGRTWIEQYNWCQVMRDQGVPCTVPPPP